ncbi:hypothetical protein CQ046_18830 [Chryseobacterium sp. MYb7]|nr:hypothetical protein CQ046_18830 [Chryseobacterium sp. MYb7]
MKTLIFLKMTSNKIESHLESLGKLNLGIVNGSYWKRKDGINVIHIHLVFNLLTEDEFKSPN